MDMYYIYQCYIKEYRKDVTHLFKRLDDINYKKNRTINRIKEMKSLSKEEKEKRITLLNEQWKILFDRTCDRIDEIHEIINQLRKKAVDV